MTSRRSRAPSICSRIACEAATNPPGITCASATGVEPGSAGSGKQAPQSSRQRSAMAVEAREEGRLRLAHNVARHAHHHVVEAAVAEVVLDSRSADPRDGAVDDVELAMVGAAELVLAAVDPLAVGEQAVAVGRQHVVHDDLGARRGEPGEHRPRLP